MKAKSILLLALLAHPVACDDDAPPRPGNIDQTIRVDGGSDTRQGDLTSQDIQGLEQGLPDSSGRDGPAGDGPAGDMALQDLAAQDAAGPDASLADLPPPPDLPLPDLPLPDQSPPDSQLRDAVPPPAALPETVLIVYNSAETESAAVADYYALKRGIPAQHKCAITPGHASYIPWTDFEDKIRTPIQGCLNAVGPSKILYIVFAYRTPYKFYPKPPAPTSPSWLTFAGNALDGYVVDIWGNTTGQTYVGNPYYASASSKNGAYPAFLSFRDWRLLPTSPLIYNVWRLDAADAALAQGLVDKAMVAEADGVSGTGYFDRRYTNISGVNDSSYGAGDWDVHRAAEFVQQAGYTVVEDENSEEFGTAPAPLTCPDALFYAGWYSLNNYNDVFTWQTGAVGIHIDSASAADPRGGNNWSANAIIKGITATAGAVGEPYLGAIPHSDGLFKNLLEEGANVGDAVFRNTNYIKWMIINLGDPLYRPFPL